ncbi:MAG TPA: acyltransferase [Planctomycetaceae bacterium]|jgi:peptidoglycan/LPS O-acetylase OafA/YrhL|nr:acyltransferase [Planctomycetaceae bacterium]
MTVESSSAHRHIPALNGLRALAVTAVIFCHVSNTWDWEQIAQSPLSQPFTVLFGWGWAGVDLFFVLSGFLITGILYDAKGKGGYFRNFYARRALRIMPLYYGFLSLTLVLLPAVLPHLPTRLSALLQVPELTPGQVLSLLLYYSNWQIAFTHHSLDLFTPFWSLAVEEHFYLLWPLAVWLFSGRSLMRVCILGAIASLGFRMVVIGMGADDQIARLITPGALDGLLCGAWLAIARRDPAAWSKARRWTLPVLGVSGAIVLCLVASKMQFVAGLDLRMTDKTLPGGFLIGTLGIVALALFFGALLARILDAPEESPLRRLLERPSLMAIGKYSYAIYVFHSLILIYLYRLAAGRLAPYIPLSPAKVIIALSLLGISFVAAWLSYYSFEIHFLRLKRFFEYGRQPRPQVLTTAPQSVEL